jgi:hypothetical protein
VLPGWYVTRSNLIGIQPGSSKAGRYLHVFSPISKRRARFGSVPRSARIRPAVPDTGPALSLSPLSLSRSHLPGGPYCSTPPRLCTPMCSYIEQGPILLLGRPLLPCRPQGSGPVASLVHRVAGKSSSRKLRSSEGRLLFLLAHHQNRAVCVSDNVIGYTPHQCSSYSAATAAACYYQTRSYFLG